MCYNVQAEKQLKEFATLVEVIMVFTSENFDKEVLQAEGPVLVDFYADWCGPCKMMSPIVEQMENVFSGRLKVGKINVDDAPDIAGRYNVMSIPTFLFFRDGQLAESFVGAMPPAVFQEKISSLLG